jgi:pyruvate,water dikinase
MLFEKEKGLLPPRIIGKVKPNDFNSTNKDKICNENNLSDTVQPLKGIATFNGTIKGRIIRGIPQSVEEECILVVFHGHCAEITHLLSRVKGLIFENGSPFDHLGIISREMNIPAIYYVKNALSTLKSGDRVEIDGDNGRIRLVKD